MTPLATRIFACWALLATIVGYHTALDINNKTLYRLTLFTFYLALGFYGFETCVTKTIPFFPALLPAVVIACESHSSFQTTKNTNNTHTEKERKRERECVRVCELVSSVWLCRM